MKKFVRLSLVAAVAVAGLSTTASAQSVSDAIKGVSVKGYFEYRWDKSKGNTFKAGSAEDAEKFRIQATAKANDAVSLTVRATSQNDSVLKLDRKYVTANVAGASVLLGKFSDPSPFTDALGINGEAVVYSPVKGITLIGATYHMNQGQAATEDNNNIMGWALLGSMDPINYKLWYVAHKNMNNYTFVSVDATIAGAKIELAYSGKTDETSDDTEKQSQTRLVVSGEVANISLKAALVKAGKNGADVTLDGDSDAKANFQSTQLSVDKVKDETGKYVSIGTSLTPDIGASLEYFKIGAYKDTTAQLTYKIAKNTSSYLRYSKGTYKDCMIQTNDVRISIKYSF
jgi:hypothetical protein